VIEAHGSEATPPVAETVGQLVCVCSVLAAATATVATNDEDGVIH
jgi:hypothetical protein